MTARYLTAARLRELESKLGDRDLAVIHELAALRFANGSQLARLCFARSDRADTRAARRALRRMTQLEAIERLPRAIGGQRTGSESFVYHLAPAGQRLSMERGWLPRSRPRRPSLPGRLFVRHALDVAELHAQLSEAARTERFELLQRDAEPACWREAGGFVLKPDTFIRLGIAEYEWSYFIEVDRGTEGSGAIRRQLGRYLSYHHSGREQDRRGVFPKVLWLAPDAHRVEAIAEQVASLPATEPKLFAAAHFDDALASVAPEGATDNALQNTF